MNQVPRQALAVAPIIPRVDPETGTAMPLGLVCIGTFFTPPSTLIAVVNQGPGPANARNAKRNEWRSAVLVIGAPTKYVYVRPCRLRAAMDAN
jgi:hypothetical protein